MHNITHAPRDYKCPFCAVANWWDLPDDGTKTDDIFYRDEYITAFISNRYWKNNKGNAIIIPNKHFENLYDMPDEFLVAVQIFSRKLAIAMKQLYRSDGISLRQHNEPAWNQDVWHYHLHVFPRYTGDNLYELNKEKYHTPIDERKHFAAKLRDYFFSEI